MTQKAGYVDSEFLRQSGAFLRTLKERSYQAMRLQPGQTVLDVGCGPGLDIEQLVPILGPKGSVYGVDHDSAMISEAQQRIQAAGYEPHVQLCCLDAAQLPFPDHFFDACRCERTLQHAPQRTAILQQMVRVTKPGGWIVACDPDWGSCALDTRERAIERRLLGFLAEHHYQHGYTGRELFRLVQEQGLQSAHCEVLPFSGTSYAFARQLWGLDLVERNAIAQGALSAEEVARLRVDCERADAKRQFFAYGCMMVAAGQKPLP